MRRSFSSGVCSAFARRTRRATATLLTVNTPPVKVFEAFADLMLSDFPVTMELFDAATGDLLSRYEMPEPGACRLERPNRPCLVRVTFGNGDVFIVDSKGFHQEIPEEPQEPEETP